MARRSSGRSSSSRCLTVASAISSWIAKTSFRYRSKRSAHSMVADCASTSRAETRRCSPPAGRYRPRHIARRALRQLRSRAEGPRFQWLERAVTRPSIAGFVSAPWRCRPSTHPRTNGARGRAPVVGRAGPRWSVSPIGGPEAGSDCGFALHPPCSRDAGPYGQTLPLQRRVPRALPSGTG